MNNLPLFDLNGDIGTGAIKDAGFPDVESLLEHMDSLGIERSLVTHVHGRDVEHAAVGEQAVGHEGMNMARPGISPACRSVA